MARHVVHGGMCTKVWSWDIKGGDILEDIGVAEGIVLKWILTLWIWSLLRLYLNIHFLPQRKQDTVYADREVIVDYYQDSLSKMLS
jgi:hypothetical protein